MHHFSLGLDFSSRGCLNTGTGSPGKWSQHQPGRFQEAFGQHSEAHGVILGVACGGPGAAFDDPDGPLPKSAYSMLLSCLALDVRSH